MTPVVFDLDGTLIDSLPNVAEAANAVLAEAGLPALENSVVAGFVGLGEQVFIDRMIDQTALEPAARRQIMDDFIRHYKTVGKRTLLMPGAEAALTQLQSDGVPLGLCTNKPRGPLMSVLEATGMDSWFSSIVAGDDLPRRKPDPAMLHHALNELGAERGIFVGDTVFDAQTAQAAGMPFVLYTEGIRTQPICEIPHDVAFSDFAELGEMLSQFQ